MAKKQSGETIAPIARADMGPTKPDAGVMATKPATAPDAAPRAVGLPRKIHSRSSQESMAMAAAVLVTMKAEPARPLAASAEPALKPNQPNHSKPAPRRTMVMLWGRMVEFAWVLRLPMTRATTRAA